MTYTGQTIRLDDYTEDTEFYQYDGDMVIVEADTVYNLVITEAALRYTMEVIVPFIAAVVGYSATGVLVLWIIQYIVTGGV